MRLVKSFVDWRRDGVFLDIWVLISFIEELEFLFEICFFNVVVVEVVDFFLKCFFKGMFILGFKWGYIFYFIISFKMVFIIVVFEELSIVFLLLFIDE